MDFYKKNAIIVIDTDGKICAIPRNESMAKHQDAFVLLKKYLGEDVFTDMEEFPRSGGFDLASFVAAQGNIVIWPSDIKNSEYMIVTLPSPCLTEEQVNSINQIEPVFQELQNHKVYVQSSKFKKPTKKSKVVNSLLYQKEDFNGAMKVIDEYVKTSEKLYGINSDILDGDIRDIIPEEGKKR